MVVTTIIQYTFYFKTLVWTHWYLQDTEWKRIFHSLGDRSVIGDTKEHQLFVMISQISVRLCPVNLFTSTWSHGGNMSSFRLYNIILTLVWVRRFQKTRSYWRYISPNWSFFIYILFLSIIDDSDNSWRKILRPRFSILLAVITIVYHHSAAYNSLSRRSQSSLICPLLLPNHIFRILLQQY